MLVLATTAVALAMMHVLAVALRVGLIGRADVTLAATVASVALGVRPASSSAPVVIPWLHTARVARRTWHMSMMHCADAYAATSEHRRGGQRSAPDGRSTVTPAEVKVLRCGSAVVHTLRASLLL